MLLLCFIFCALLIAVIAAGCTTAQPGNHSGTRVQFLLTDAVINPVFFGEEEHFCSSAILSHSGISAVWFLQVSLDNGDRYGMMFPEIQKTSEGDYGVITIFSNLISRFWLFASDGSEQDIMASLVTCPPAFMVPR